jgi:hypothetical protein
MTDDSRERPASPAAPRPPRARIKAPGPFAVVAAASGAFFALAGAFAIQERLAPAAAQPVAAAPPQVVVRRVIVTRVVSDARRRTRPRATTTSPAPAPATPARAPATPAPGPLTTRTS